MTEFEEIFASGPAPLFIQKQGEPLIYRPLNGLARPITGMVDRGPPEGSEAAGVLAPQVVIEVLDDPIEGIESRVLGNNPAGHSIDVCLQPGCQVTTLEIKRRLPQSDNGMLKLECG